MRLVTYAEIDKLENGETIPSLRGTITAVYGRKSGVGKGPWSFQDALLDMEGGQIKLKIASHEDISELKGKPVEITSWVSDNGLVGVTKLVENYTDKQGVNRTSHKVQVAKQGTIMPLGAKPSPQAAPQAAPPVSVPPPAQEAPPEAQEPVPAASHGELETKRKLRQLANYALLSWSAAQYVEDKLAELGQMMSPEEMQGLWASLRIDGVRAGLHLGVSAGDFHWHPKVLAKFAPETQPDPEPEPMPQPSARTETWAAPTQSQADREANLAAEPEDEPPF